MDPKLIQVVEKGKVDSFYELLGEDPYILDKVEKIPFINTPLHLAVLAGNTDVVMEIINLKPSYNLKLNPEGFSPLHLASRDGRLEMVKVLLKDEKSGGGGLCNLQGREKLIPLHCAAIAATEEHIKVLEILLSTCPKSIKALTVKEESVLHLAVKYGKVEAFKVLLSWLRKHWYHDILSQKDQQGNTILHLAVLQRQDEIIKVLLHSGLFVRDAVGVNEKNNEGSTALDLLMNDLTNNTHREGMKSILSDVGAKKAKDIGCQPLKEWTTTWVLKLVYKSKVTRYLKLKVDMDTPSDVRNALLVIVVLIVTATYQTGVSPPGGYWQEDSTDHIAGEPIWSTVAPVTYNLVMLFNFGGFMLSLLLAYNLTSGFPLRGPLLLALVFMLLTYSWSTPIFYNGPAAGPGAVTVIAAGPTADIIVADTYFLNTSNLMLWLPIAFGLIIWAITANWMEPIWCKLSLLTRLGRIRARAKNQRTTTGPTRSNADGIFNIKDLDRSIGDDSVA